MSAADYDIVPYEPRHRDGVLALLTPLWGTDPERNRACMEWKYETNPYGPPLLHLALKEGIPVGVRAFVPSCWQSGSEGSRYPCVADADAVVRPEHRRQGLLKRMTVAGLKELESGPFRQVITIGAASESASSNLAMGWSMPGQVEIMRRWSASVPAAGPGSGVSRIRRIARRVPWLKAAFRAFTGRKGAGPESPGTPFRMLDLRLGSRSPGEPVRLAREPDIQLMEGVVTARNRSGIRHVRDREYLAWRYRNPLADYRFLSMSRGDDEGYLVLQSSLSNPSGTVTIVDWETDKPRVLENLVRTAIREGEFDRLEIWSTSLCPEERDALRRLGFIDTVSAGHGGAGAWPILVMPLACREPRIGSADMMDLNAWDLRGVFSDCY